MHIWVDSKDEVDLGETSKTLTVTIEKMVMGYDLDTMRDVIKAGAEAVEFSNGGGMEDGDDLDYGLMEILSSGLVGGREPRRVEGMGCFKRLGCLGPGLVNACLSMDLILGVLGWSVGCTWPSSSENDHFLEC
ncbi:hypothetical protein IFM89_022764 [Coptis chinensis]|uniref:Uncharacterized protein n=1 Tax=Coptis chinensis TaxID=261450 RepID=A0A835IRV5_9MAGN|nr:hypothetical protein IFM89_022764 [Coptis chinensis]